MENISIAIVSGDGDYNRVLSMALTNACREMSVEIFNNREFVRLWSDYDGPGAFYDNFDIILWAGDEVCESYSDNIVYLADNASQANMNFDDNRFCLYRYESVRSLIVSISEIYAHLSGKKSGRSTAGNSVLLTDKNVSILGFSSCYGGSGCTTLAMAVGQELARFHKKRVLYVSLEDVESMGEIVTDISASKGIGEYLYRLLGKDCCSADIPIEPIPAADTQFLDSYLIRNAFGVEAFVPSRGKNPLRELKEDEMQKFLSSLMTGGRYDTIVADISTCLTEAGMRTMEMADRICLVSEAGRSEGREANYLNQVKHCGHENLMSKIVKVENNRGLQQKMNYEGSTAPESMAAGAKATHAMTTVRRYKGNSADGASDILLEGGFGSDISHLTELLLQ